MREPRWLPLDLVLAFEPLARSFGVSEVARSPRGFLKQYRLVGGDPDRLSDYWRNRRNAFVARHWAQVEARGEPLVVEGIPSRRLLALIMWAAAPSFSDQKLVRILDSID